MAKYKIATVEAAERYGAEQDTVVELDLSEDEARAVVAAGWVEPHGKAATTQEGAK